MPVHLKRLTLRNFKSFRSVSIPFAKGFTAIMGPNGSGKSNIIDALLFVLGEGKLKHIRASRLKDLVFHGARDGIAVVSLDLSDGQKDYTITRMIDKKGRSVYKLNGKRAMRHEIISLLSSLGVSYEGYNIVLQGEITRLFNMSPLERRGIIDQVAGIAEYEEKKAEAFKELEKVDAEIEDAELILNERKTVLKRLEEERNAALEYIELKKKLRALRRSILEKRLSELREHIKRVEDKIRLSENEIERKSMERGKINERVQEVSSRINEIDRQIKELLGMSAGHLEAARVKYASLESEISRKKDEREELLRRLSNISVRKERIERELRVLESEIQDIRVRLREKETSLSEVSRKLSEMLTKIRAGEEETNRAKKRLVEIEENLSKLRDDFVKLKEEHSRLVGEYNTRLEQLKKEEEKARKEAARIEEYRKELGVLIDEKKKLEKRRKELIEREKALNREYLALSEEIKKLREKLGMYRGASAALRSLGVGIDVLDALLQAQREGKLRGIHGFIAQLIKYDQKYSAAIEAAAGRRLFYIVVDSADAAADAIKFLKREGIGSATFAPLDRVRGNVTDVPSGDGILGRLLDFVTFDRIYRPVMEYVFGDTLLVRDVDVAKRLAGRYRAVTLDGDIVERTGIMSGGARRGRNILDLFRAAELKKELQEREAQTKEILSELYKIRDEVQEITSRMSAVDERARQIEQRIEEYGSETHTIDLSILERRLKELEQSMQQIASKISDLELEKAQILSKLRGEESTDIRELDSLKQEQDVLSNEVSELRMLLAKKEERRKSLKSTLESLNAEETNVRKRMEEITAELDKLEADLGVLKQKILQMETEYAEQRRKISELQEERERLEQEKARLIAKLTNIDGEIRELEKDIAIFHEKIQSLSADEQDIRRELGDYADVTPAPLPENPQEEIDRIIKRMQGLEPVNMRAIEEYEEQKKKIEEVEEKINHLKEERRSVLELIDSIERKKVRAFMETFASISALFSKIYTDLTGGRATLRLTDEEQVFNSGLIIEAQPKGKPLKNIDAMSGGEKALVALAFIFAIAMYKPIGFYVLDEPDLMLDKANAEKMARFIKKLSKSNQFIVVSHRDVVLKEADQIIGVYMKEDGSSAIELLLSREGSCTARQAS